MKRAIGFMIGLRGDLAMSTVAARSFKQKHPDWHLTLGVGPQFADLLPLFYQHESFDNFHSYTTYADWPGPEDLDYLKRAKYDLIFHGLPQHRDEWWKFRHQYAETAYMVGLPVSEDITPSLSRWFHVADRRDTVAIAPFGGNGETNDKMLTVGQAQWIVDHLVARGWKVIHLGAPGEPDLVGAPRPNVSYFEAVRFMLSCRALIHCDTGMGHFAGAYNHPSLGIYGYRYHGQAGIKNIQPLHPNFTSVEGPLVDKIELDTLTQAADTLLEKKCVAYSTPPLHYSSASSRPVSPLRSILQWLSPSP